MGDRLTLINSVLTNIRVYWISLCKVKKSILYAINHKIFKFLWPCSRERTEYHLVKWDYVARPNSIGGWGKNVFKFAKALSTKKLWWALFMDSLWHWVIMEKYFKKIDFE